MGKSNNEHISNANLQTLVNNSQSASLRKIDVTQSADGGSFIFFHGRKHASAEDFYNLLQDKLSTVDLISKTTVDDQPIIIARTTTPIVDITQEWQNKTGQELTAAKVEKKKVKSDLIKMRGTIGNIGQLFMIASGFLDGENKGKFKVRKDNGELNKNGIAKISSAVISLAGNGVNTIYGVQKKC